MKKLCEVITFWKITITCFEKKIEGKLLEESQKKAISASAKNICVNAGAGSGKTFTILAKVIHLLEQKLATEDEIVIVAYNTRVATELRERIFKQSKIYPNLEKQLKIYCWKIMFLTL